MDLAQVLKAANSSNIVDEKEGLPNTEGQEVPLVCVSLEVVNEEPAAVEGVSENVRSAIGVGEGLVKKTATPSSLDEDGLVTYLTPAPPAALPAEEGEAMAADLDWLAGEEGRAVA